MSNYACADCQHPTDGPLTPQCPQCGGRRQIANMSANLTGSSRMFAGFRLKKAGVKKPIFESVHRLETQVSTGRRVEKKRVIDRVENKYSEHVVDDETRQTIHLCEEPLDSHKGHGSAKKKHD